jgi:hypothetical protein
MLFSVAGLILDSVARGRAEQKRMAYLSYGSVRGETLEFRQSNAPAGNAASTPAANPAVRAA